MVKMSQWPEAIETLFKHHFLSMSMAYPSGQPATIFWQFFEYVFLAHPKHFLTIFWVCIFDPSKTIVWVLFFPDIGNLPAQGDNGNIRVHLK